jgi:large conductance mechanosensitive channel
MGGFREFLTKSNALALAIGVVIGGALGAVVNSLVNDVIMPPIGWALGGVDFASIKTVLGTNADGEEVAIGWGLLINALIVFVIVALVAYLMTRLLISEPPAEPTKECPFCKEANAVAATKCKACTSAI